MGLMLENPKTRLTETEGRASSWLDEEDDILKLKAGSQTLEDFVQTAASPEGRLRESKETQMFAAGVCLH